VIFHRESKIDFGAKPISMIHKRTPLSYPKFAALDVLCRFFSGLIFEN
jgi:hypothetical protein